MESTAKSAVACVRVLMGEPPEPLDPWRLYASEPTVRVVNKVIAVQSKYWKCCRPEISMVDEASPPPERLNGSHPDKSIIDEEISFERTRQKKHRNGGE